MSAPGRRRRPELRWAVGLRLKGLLRVPPMHRRPLAPEGTGQSGQAVFQEFRRV